MPVFFIQDALKFPDLIHAVKPEQDNEMPQAASAHDTFWDFISLTPESMHMIMWLMSDRALPRSFRMMEGFGVHTFRFVDAGGISRFVKFHWKPVLGVHSVAWDEAQKISGKDPDFLRRDLWEAIEQGNYPEYELGVQVVEEEREHEFDFDLLDPTKLIPEELVPVERVGRLVLNRNPDNFFAETEQVAFHPGHVVPGHRLHQRSAAAGPPLLVHRHAADPARRAELPRDPDQPLGRAGAQPPARRLHAPDDQPRQGVLRAELDRRRLPDAGALRGGRLRRASPSGSTGAKMRARSEKFFDHFSQATLFFDSQSPPEQDHIVEALRFELGKVERPAHPRAHDRAARLRERGAGAARGRRLRPARDPAASRRRSTTTSPRTVAPERLRVEARPEAGRASRALSMADTVKDTVRSRRVSILVADGVDADSLRSVREALLAEGALPVLVGAAARPARRLEGRPALGRAEPAHRLLRALRRGLRAGRRRRRRARRGARRDRLDLRGLSPLQADRRHRRRRRAPAPLPGRTRRRSREAPGRVARARSTGMLRVGRAGVRGVRRDLRGGDRPPPLLGARREEPPRRARRPRDPRASARARHSNVTAEMLQSPDV